MIDTGFIYLLCAITSLICMILLAVAYRRTRSRLLFWSACCFVGLAINNALVFIDISINPVNVDLQLPRLITSLVGTSLLVYGFISDVDS
jgi:hypothetical protein